MSPLSVALVVGSAYERNRQLAPLPSAALDCELVERRLSDRDAGFRVFRFEAERGLAERIEQRLNAQTEPIERLLFYFSGYCAVSRFEERTPGLILDGARLGTFSLLRVRRLLRHYAPKSAGVILDAALVSDRAEAPRTTLRELGALLTGGSSGLDALVATRPGDRPDSVGRSAFTGVLLMVIDWLVGARKAGQPVDLAWVFEGLKVDPAFFQAIPAVSVFPERSRFVLVPPAQSIGTRTRPPESARAPRQPELEGLPGFAYDDGDDGLEGLTPPFASTRPPRGPSSFPEAPRDLPRDPAPARPKLPSFEPSPEVGDALFQAGEFARAVEEYAAVLDFVTEPRARSVLLAKQAQALAALGRANESGLIPVEAQTLEEPSAR